MKFLVGTPEGKPVPGAKVFQVGENGQREELSRYFSGRRGATFQGCGLLPGKHKFVVEAEGWKTVEKIVEVKEGEGEGVEVELEPDKAAGQAGRP